MNTPQRRACLPLLAIAVLLTGCGAALGASHLSATAPAAAMAQGTTSALTAESAAGATANATEPPYLDDRSDAVAVLSSFYNAINRREYARAYGYWRPGATTLPSYQDFEQGYSATQSVTLTTGSVQSDAGAGQRNYRVAVILEAQLRDGSTQTFAGCYDLHLASPAIQTPPFEPLSITAASIQQVTGGANPADVINERCAGL